MATTMASTSPDTLVTLKINIDGHNKRYNLPLRDLGASTLPEKLRAILCIPPATDAVFERYSDSAAAFVVLDPSNAAVYKQLYRAAKAKLKLRLRVTLTEKTPIVPRPATVEDEEAPVSATEERQRTLDRTTAPQQQSTASQMTSSTAPKTETETKANGNITVPVTKIPIRCPYAMKASTDVPVSRGVSARAKWFSDLNLAAQARQEAVQAPPLPCSLFTVYCNNCNEAIPDQHYHCSTCDDGDFDLCQTCVDGGVTCQAQDHWLIKRFVSNGKVINSTTQIVPPKRAKPAVPEAKPVLVTPQPHVEQFEATRTCNSCIEELTKEHFITCLHCEDFDLCMTCHVNNVHGHNPKHAFAPAVPGTHLSAAAKALLPAGRNVVHNAVCDGCDKFVHGVRFKCLDCPDWDFCSACILNANYVHPRHRFVPIYEALHDSVSSCRSFSTKARHHGIYCDGPLCNNDGHHSYIKGDRFKCAVCDDTDFCANCEASPINMHNKTHPLIKFKMPVRNCTVTTLGDHENGQPLPVMGDRRGRTTSQGTETTPAASTNAATQVQTVADLQPTTETQRQPESEKSASIEDVVPAKPELVAHFVRDAVADGTVLPANHVFPQTWYLRNGGQTAWPAGCSVKFVGGDNMCAVDPEHPASVHELVSAAESTTSHVEVVPGQEVGFTVLMRTPNRIGNFISYWRLTGPEGEKFGHRLWCDVTVKEVEVKTAAENVKEGVVIAKTEDKAAEPATTTKVESEGSQMIFPKLEKESPAASVHQAVAVPTSAEAEEFEDFVEESLAGESDDGFLTDEEYDILDASDEEYLAEQAKAAKK